MLQNNTYICWQHDVRLETMLNREKLRGNLYPEWTLKKLEKGHLSLFHVRNCNVPTLRKCTGCSAEIFTLFTFLNLLKKGFRIKKNLFPMKVRYTSCLLGAQISILRYEPFAAESIFREVCLKQHKLV